MLRVLLTADHASSGQWPPVVNRTGDGASCTLAEAHETRVPVVGHAILETSHAARGKVIEILVHSFPVTTSTSTGRIHLSLRLAIIRVHTQHVFVIIPPTSRIAAHCEVFSAELGRGVPTYTLRCAGGANSAHLGSSHGLAGLVKVGWREPTWGIGVIERWEPGRGWRRLGGGIGVQGAEAGRRAAKSCDRHAGKTTDAVGAFSLLKGGGRKVVVVAGDVTSVGSVAAMSIFDGRGGEGGEGSCRAGWGAAGCQTRVSLNDGS